MSLRRSLIGVGLIVLLVASVAVAAQKQQAMSQKEMMDRMMKYAAVTKAHDFLKNYVGKWDVEVKAFEQPGGQPMVSKGSMTGELIMGGRFALCRFQGEMMAMPFMGLQLMGYDLFKNKYAGIWIDSMSTAYYPTTGTLDDSGKILNEAGMWPNPMTGGSNPVRIVTTLLGPGKYTWQMFQAGPDGKESMSMEITYTKKM
jgi:hypothetical protein